MFCFTFNCTSTLNKYLLKRVYELPPMKLNRESVLLYLIRWSMLAVIVERLQESLMLTRCTSTSEKLSPSKADNVDPH